MSGTSILRSDSFFLFSPRHCPLFPLPSTFFFPDSFQLICMRSIFFGYFSIFFYGISFELGPFPFFLFFIFTFFMGYVSSLLTTKKVEELVGCYFYSSYSVANHTSGY